MTKHVLVLGGQSHEAQVEELLNSTTGYLSGLTSTAGLDADYSYSFFDTIDYVVGDQGVRLIDARNQDRPLESYDLVLLRVKVAPYKAFAQIVAAYLGKRDVKCVNSDYAAHKPSGKLAQMVAFSELGVPVPHTLYASSPRMLARAPQVIGFPMVVKGIHAAQGRDNHLVKDLDNLKGLVEIGGGHSYVAQQFIPNDCDYRILMLGNEHLVIRRRGSGDTHLNNLSTGGSAEIVGSDFFEESVYGHCRTIMQHMGLDWAGIDVMLHQQTGDPYFLEVNSLPQLDSGAFKDEKAALLATYLRDTLV